MAQTTVLDLRDRSVARGGEPTPGKQPLELSRAVKHLNVYLPLGSAEGRYELPIAPTGGSAIFTTSGVATLNGGVTSIEAGVDLPPRPLGDMSCKSEGLIQSGTHILSYCDESFVIKLCPPIRASRYRDVLYRFVVPTAAFASGTE
jgi:hypothetical protein